MDMKSAGVATIAGDAEIDRLRQCDREHLPAYLWSSNPLNISLYKRHGFEIAGTIQVGSSPSIFAMLRPAKSD